MTHTDLYSWFGSPHLEVSNAQDPIRIHGFSIELHRVKVHMQFMRLLFLAFFVSDGIARAVDKLGG
jgi:hypothetical protein